MKRSDTPTPIESPWRLRIFPSPATLPLSVYRDFVDMLFSMRLPIFGLGAVFVGVCILVGRELGSNFLLALGALGMLTTFLRLATLRAYSRARPVRDFDELRRWERRYAIGNYASAVLLALLNLVAIAAHYPLLHLITVSLVFGFGAGIVSRTSIRPKICVTSLLIATVPTVAALAWHPMQPHAMPLHAELFLIEAFIVAMITGLSLQTVAHLYRSAVEHHTARHDMAKLARTDALTGLSNRLLLRELFQDRAATAMRAKNLVALHFLDLDGFKAINDRYGHPAGDALLEQVARRLEGMVRSDDVVARLGGDEFVVLQVDLSDESEAELLARRIIREISKPYLVDDISMSVSVSVGIATAPKLGVELERLLSCADAALYRAKAGGKARALFCVEEDAAIANIAA
ncbi:MULTISPECIES: GGDEF domain-containing protein [unclassified Sphingopyxis]|jgi:diguanylate cyclase (GGDEF)-like protein|uniref:GGDEF domain-containing protein n=1 Tax=unclassified Sphingopyxis TaxID=2614943 RepID=UPI00285668F8|nr:MULTISPECIES: GGDEF domain-containing protein [unclassified Sphingopyxis]MDR7060967.1 diguanylate cyclase (GGDEF)-like protein [Sphingopyxis sp. BE235]MDR7181424.1 diguanylate cyclase (GGDEF)-like protein [Sphingopyxis sp. BE249]